MELTTVGTPALWIGFTVFVLAMLALDLGVFHRDAHEVRAREALTWSLIWIALALLFGAWIYAYFGSARGLEFFTGYLIEKALAVDNIFVFLVVFSAFAVPTAYQHRVLLWGVLGALVMRALFIVLGAALLERFHWVMYVFGAFLTLTGAQMLVRPATEPHPERNALFRLFARVVPSVADYHGSRFSVVRGGRRYATPLLLALLCIETSDLVFAVDSIPAIFAVTRDPFIVYTSNIFAILGLRAMFFLLADMVQRFQYLHMGLALVLTFVGTKMLLADLYPIPITASLGIVLGLLASAVLASLFRRPADVVDNRGSAISVVRCQERKALTEQGAGTKLSQVVEPRQHTLVPTPRLRGDSRDPRRRLTAGPAIVGTPSGRPLHRLAQTCSAALWRAGQILRGQSG